MPINKTSSSAAAAGRDKGTLICRYKTAAGQTLTNATFVLIDFGTKDPGVTTANGTVTTGASWKYTSSVAQNVMVNVNFRVARFSAIVNYAVAIYLNGTLSTYLDDTYFAGGNGDLGRTINANACIPLAINDYIDIRVYQDSGTNRALTAAAEENFIEIIEV